MNNLILNHVLMTSEGNLNTFEIWTIVIGASTVFLALISAVIFIFQQVQHGKQHDEKINLEKQKQFDDKQYRRLKFIKDFSTLSATEKRFINLYEQKYLETDITLRTKELEKELHSNQTPKN